MYLSILIKTIIIIIIILIQKKQAKYFAFPREKALVESGLYTHYGVASKTTMNT